jgi:hypothetical protein
MAAPPGTLASSRLRRLARGAARERQARLERCELCGEPIPASHRHLLDLSSRELLCACRACTVLFDRREAGVGHYRLVGERRLRLEGFVLDEAAWAALAIPVELAFFFRDEAAGRVQAFYPSPAGATESLLDLVAWERLERANPVLATLEPDVEALLVQRARGARRYFVVPIDDAFRLVGVIRTHWRGLSGGREVWERVDAFFAALAERAQTVDDTREEMA